MSRGNRTKRKYQVYLDDDCMNKIMSLKCNEFEESESRAICKALLFYQSSKVMIR